MIQSRKLTNANVGLQSPWYYYVSSIQALFKLDPAITTVFNDDDLVLKIYVEGAAKADALAQVLPTKKEFGNITMTIEIIPDNVITPATVGTLEDLFEGNDLFAYIKVVAPSPVTFGATYVVFKKAVVQYYVDDLSTLNGFRSVLAQDLAKEVLENVEHLNFCTELKD